MEPSIFKYKVVVVGEGTVGKTSVIMRYTENVFRESYITTIGTNFATKEVTLGDQTRVKIQLWDIAGTPSFGGLRPVFFAGANGVVYVYDITKAHSFRALLQWKEDIEKVVPNPVSILIGNKRDLEPSREVPSEAGARVSKKIGASAFLEVSAKTGENIPELFQELIQHLHASNIHAR